MFWPSMNMNVHPNGKIKFHDIYQESCTTLSRLTLGNIPETEPRSIINTHEAVVHVGANLHLSTTDHGLMPQPPSSQCLQKLKP
jgi:hypothetical protein